MSLFRSPARSSVRTAPFHPSTGKWGGRSTASWTFDRVVTATAISTASHTFSGYNIGTAEAARVVCFAVCSSGAINRAVASATINGVAATSIQIANVTGGTPRLSLWYAVVPAGTTGIDIVVTFTSSGSNMELACACWYGYPVVSTPLDSGQAIGNSISSQSVNDIQIATGGLVIAATASSSLSGDPFSMSWTGTDTPTEHADTSIGSGLAYAFYSFVPTANTTTDDATFTASVSASMGSVVAAFGG